MDLEVNQKLVRGEQPDKVSKSLTVDEIYGRIRAEILSGALVPGAAVSQVQLARRLGVNRTPLREALRMLQREGLVNGDYNQRVRISSLSSSDLEDLYATRIVMEAAGLRISATAFTAVDIANMRESLGHLDEQADAGDFGAWEVRHREFHSLLVCHAGNRLRANVADLFDYCERYRRALIQVRPGATYAIGAEEHAAIVQACEDHAPDEAARLLARHLGRTALSLLSVSEPTHDPSSVREALRMVIGDGTLPTPFKPFK